MSLPAPLEAGDDFADEAALLAGLAQPTHPSGGCGFESIAHLHSIWLDGNKAGVRLSLNALLNGG